MWSWACWCAASAFAGGGLRKGLDRQRARGWFRVSGSGLGPRLTQDSSFLRCQAMVLRLSVLSVDLQPQERFCGCRSTDGGGRRGRGSPFSWTVPREGRSAAHPTPKGNQDSAFERARPNASAFTTGSRRQRRILRPPQHQPATRDPRPARMPAARSRPFGDHPQRQPRQRTSKVDTARGSAAAGRDPRRQRSSRARPPQAAQQRGHDHPLQRTSTAHLPLPRRAWRRCVGR